MSRIIPAASTNNEPQAEMLGAVRRFDFYWLEKSGEDETRRYGFAKMYGTFCTIRRMHEVTAPWTALSASRRPV